VFFLRSSMKTARGLGLLRGFGDFLRDIFKQRRWYEDRRTLQVTASIAVAVVVVVLLVWSAGRATGDLTTDVTDFSGSIDPESRMARISDSGRGSGTSLAHTRAQRPTAAV
jgi:hypothetical protein